jgi:Cof subfamily protein (haloacid dehalogenase superfamily)
MVDLDGTLIGPGLRIARPDRMAIARALECGVDVCLATGRLFDASRRFADELQLRGYITVLQGSQIYELSTGRLVHAAPLQRELALQAFDALKARGFHLQLYFGDRLYLDELDERARYYLSMSQVQPEVVSDLRTLLDGSPPPGPGPMKVLGVDDPAKVSSTVPLLARTLGPAVSVFKSQPAYLEVIDAHADKAGALRWIAAARGIALADTAAIGDSDNDVTMLRLAGRSFAVGNATPAAKQAAQTVVAPVDRHGVADAVEILMGAA